MMMDMLILIACIGRVFLGFCGIHFIFSTTQNHPSTRDDSFLRMEFRSAVPP